MAFPGNAPAASDYQIESFAVDPRARAGAVTPDQLVIPDPRDAWHYMVNAASLQCVRGYIVPKLAVVSFQPGLNGNSKNRSRGEGALQGMVARGFQPVPHDFPVVAWGEPRTQAHPVTRHHARPLQPRNAGHHRGAGQAQLARQQGRAFAGVGLQQAEQLAVNIVQRGDHGRAQQAGLVVSMQAFDVSLDIISDFDDLLTTH